jgi:chromate reductase
VTPEYNRGLPAVLKNAIDVASRPYGQSVWNGKPAAIVSVTIGSQGAILANHQLRQSLVFLNMPTLQQPEAYISSALSLFDDKGELINDSTTEFLRLYGQAFTAWIDKVIEDAPAAKAA